MPVKFVTVKCDREPLFIANKSVLQLPIAIWVSSTSDRERFLLRSLQEETR